VGQWRSFINDTGYRTKAEIQGWSMIWTGSKWVKKKGYYWDNPEFPQTETHPVTCLSCNDVQKFIEWLTGKEGKTYRLPTETEWEYACRAGTTTPFYTGNCISTDQANYDGTHPMPGCPEGEYRKGPVEVESFEPNPWGLHDMHGNVWEWCQDKYKRDYPSGRVTDPKGPTSGWERVLRGGSWHNYAGHIRSALRYRYYPDKWLNYSGFRLAQDY
jgi:formylglycine-generating enzyme required for sulfatase activity